MGWFKDFTKKFRTGGTAAKKASVAATDAAKTLGQEHLGSLRDFGGSIQEMTAPGIGYGQDAAGLLSGYYGSQEGQQQFVDQAMQSPLYGAMLNQGEQAIARRASATGGLRGGSTNEALAQNSQNVLNSIINQRLSGLGGMADYGMQNQSNYLNSYGNNLNAQGQTLSGISGADMAHANTLSNAAAGKMGLYGGIASAGLSAAGSMFGAGAPKADEIA